MRQRKVTLSPSPKRRHAQALTLCEFPSLHVAEEQESSLYIVEWPTQGTIFAHEPWVLTQAGNLTHSRHQQDPGFVISQNEDNSYFFWTPKT